MQEEHKFWEIGVLKPGISRNVPATRHKNVYVTSIISHRRVIGKPELM
jgi:hypothetical protein